MNGRVGVDEREDLPLRQSGAAVARRPDGALLHFRHEATAGAGDLGGVIGRRVVGDDDLDLVCARLVALPGDVDAVEERRQAALLVVSGDDQRNPRHPAYKLSKFQETPMARSPRARRVRNFVMHLYRKKLMFRYRSLLIAALAVAAGSCTPVIPLATTVPP